MRDIWSLIKTTFSEFSSDNCFRLAAALAYYTLFSLAPVLVIVVAAIDLVYGGQAQGEIYNQIKALVGQQSADTLYQMMQGAFQPKQSIWATIIGTATLAVTATTVFIQLQDSLNVVWNVETTSGSGVWGFIRDRLLSFALILGVGFILLVSLVVNAALTALFGYIKGFLPGGTGVLLIVGEQAVTILIVTLLFAMIFKFLPDARIDWRDTWIGALATGVLFAVGRAGIGLYLGNSNVGSTYGSAGALVIILLWIYYSSLILFLGAEFTQVYANRRGKGIEPTGKTVERADRGK